MGAGAGKKAAAGAGVVVNEVRWILLLLSFGFLFGFLGSSFRCDAGNLGGQCACFVLQSGCGAIRWGSRCAAALPFAQRFHRAALRCVPMALPLHKRNRERLGLHSPARAQHGMTSRTTAVALRYRLPCFLFYLISLPPFTLTHSQLSPLDPAHLRTRKQQRAHALALALARAARKAPRPAAAVPCRRAARGKGLLAACAEGEGCRAE